MLSSLTDAAPWLRITRLCRRWGDVVDVLPDNRPQLQLGALVDLQLWVARRDTKLLAEPQKVSLFQPARECVPLRFLCGLFLFAEHSKIGTKDARARVVGLVAGWGQVSIGC